MTTAHKTRLTRGAAKAAVSLPPYGQMIDDFQLVMRKEPVPAMFLVNGVPPDLKTWEAWRDALVDEIAKFLWPRYLNNTWVGASAAGAVDLTLADLALMATLRGDMMKPLAARFPSSVAHKQLFLVEDDTPPGDEFHNYDTAATEGLLNALPGPIRRGVFGVLSFTLQMKREFQRPRAYQTAVLLGDAGFGYLLAKSGVTPSLVSGHCLQASVGACAAYVALRFDLEALPGTVGLLQQYLIDAGDRRVFAGVHYPSDNISSWFCALRICENLFGEHARDAKVFLWQAITTKSAVFAALKAAATVPGSPFAAPMAELLKEAARPPTVPAGPPTPLPIFTLLPGLGMTLPWPYAQLFRHPLPFL